MRVLACAMGGSRCAIESSLFMPLSTFLRSSPYALVLSLALFSLVRLSAAAAAAAALALGIKSVLMHLANSVARSAAKQLANRHPQSLSKRKGVTELSA